MRLSYVAIVVCEHESNGRLCTEMDKFVVPVEGTDKNMIPIVAVNHFREMGWKCDVVKDQPTYCPVHAPMNK